MSDFNPPEHPAWQVFCQLAEENGISLDHPDDWEFYWNVFLAGYRAGLSAGLLEHKAGGAA